LAIAKTVLVLKKKKQNKKKSIIEEFALLFEAEDG
jgi:hypothetical protein